MVNDIIYELLNELGLCVSEDNHIIYQSGEPLLFYGKDIRFSYDKRFMIDSSKEIWFDPINNLELIKNLYNRYVVTLFEDEGKKILSTKEIREPEGMKYKLNIVYIDPSDNAKVEMNTKYYKNIGVGYIQIMLLNVMNVDILDEE